MNGLNLLDRNIVKEDLGRVNNYEYIFREKS